MQFIYGLLTAAVFFLCLLFAFYAGMKYKKPPDTPDKEATDEKTVRKQAKLQEDFMKLMNYDVDQALQRKRVT